MSPSHIPLLVGVFSSTVFSAGNLVIVYHGLPALLLPYSSGTTPPPQSHLAQQWRLLFHRGHYTFPGNAILAAAAFFYAGRQAQKSLYYLAACLDLAVVPFTLILVERVNHELLRRAAWAEKEVEGEKKGSGNGIERDGTKDLVQRWGRLGAIRAVLPLLAILVAAAAEVDLVDFKLDGIKGESAGLFLGTGLLIFMVVGFGLPNVEV
jgi:Domain of unknown function (DUF1772)